MPAPPELLRTLRLIRAVEVHGQIETHQQGYTYRYVGIAREVGIHLQRVGKEREEVLEAREKQGVVEHAVDQVNSQIIRHDNLLGQTVQYPEYRQSEIAATEVIRLVQLRNKLLRTHDRTCY